MSFDFPPGYRKGDNLFENACEGNFEFVFRLFWIPKEEEIDSDDVLDGEKYGHHNRDTKIHLYEHRLFRNLPMNPIQSHTIGISIFILPF